MAVHSSPRIITDNLIFSIDAANIKSWSGPTPVPVGTDYGYFGGGNQPAKTTVDRIDFSNDTPTAATKGPLATATHGAADGLSSINYGYVAGIFPYKTNVQRVDYADDTATAVEKGPMSIGRWSSAGVSNSSYAYIAGGYAPSTVSSIDRIDYSNDTATAAPKGPLTSVSVYKSGVGNASYGYFSGGIPGTGTDIDRLDYSSDTTTCAPKGNLNNSTYGSKSTGNSNYGYVGGGPFYNGKTHVDRIDYSNDTATAAAKGPLDASFSTGGATGNSSYGYWGGGYEGTVIRGSKVSRLDFSSDTTTASPKGPLSGDKSGVAAFSSRANALPTTNEQSIWKDTSKSGDNATVEGATHQGGNKGSFLFNGTSNYVSNDDKSNLQLGSGNFTIAAWIKPNATLQGTDFGYFVGGATRPSPLHSTIDRIDFSNDTPTATAKGPLNTATYSGAATGNTSYGYFGGGASNTPGTSGFTTVDRIDYSSDTSTAATKGPLTTARSQLAATGNTSYGYWAGGYTSPGNISLIDRVDYSSDTSVAVEKGPLSSTRNTQASVGNSSYAYFASGIINWPTSTTIIDRVDFSNDTATALVKGNLGSARRKFSGTGNASYGYVGGGANPNSDVHRIDYASDTSTAVEKGPLTSARYGTGATGDTSYGYWGAGYYNKSTVDRVDFSNDTATASARGPLSLARDGLSGVSSRMNGFPTSLRTNNQGILSYSDSDGNEDATTCQFDTDINGKVRFSGSSELVTSTSATSNDTWTHAAVTRSGSAISLYINGILEDTGSSSQDFSDFAKVTIGANRPRDTFFKGEIAQLQIYKKGLSSDEIQQNYRSIKKRFDL